MESAEFVDRLAALPKLKQIPRAELEWLVEHGEFERREVGDVVSRRGIRIEHLWIVLSGEISISVDRGAGPRLVMSWTAGDVTGMLPYSRMKGPPGDNVVDEEVEALALSVEHFPEMVHRCPVFTAHTVHLMVDRARNFNTSDLHDEKMLALGRLSAGLAHELNNPASATARGAKRLRAALTAAGSTSRELGAAGLTAEQSAAVGRIAAESLAGPSDAILSPLERSDREEAIYEWLEEHDIDPSAAPALAETPLPLAALDRLAAAVPERALDVAVRWLAAGAATDALASDVERAADRIHQLVAAVKRFTHMDQHGGPESVEVEPGIRDTLHVVGSKTRSKNATVRLEIEAGLPPVRATPGELNQVWLNLIDNALDAIADGGTIAIKACRKLDRVHVSITDDGPGIPADVVEQIFDPFFTTKPPGQGTGLGLDIARRLVRRWEGDLTVESEPGKTEFCVRLEVARETSPAPPAKS